jgi:hypothetical protein
VTSTLLPLTLTDDCDDTVTSPEATIPIEPVCRSTEPSSEVDTDMLSEADTVNLSLITVALSPANALIDPPTLIVASCDVTSKVSPE